MSFENGILYPMDPPPGFERNPNEPYEATSLIVVVSVFLPCAVITTGVRIYMRTKVTGGLAKDDYLMIGSVFLDAVVMSLSLAMLKFGLGKHFWNVPIEPDLYPNWLLRNVLAATILTISTALAKGSILLFYLRIFTTRGMQWAIWGVFAYTMCYSIIGSCMTMFACQPIDGSWNFHASVTAKCIDLPVWYFASAGLNISCDIATLILPLPKLRSLRLPWKQKLGVAIVLTMGAFVCIIAVIRLSSLYALLTEKDLTRNTVTALMWCALEINLQIIGGNIPALKPFIQHLIPQFFFANQFSDTNELIRLDGRVNSVVADQGRTFENGIHKRATLSHIVAEDGSEEHIINNPGIYKTVDVDVKFSMRSNK